MEFDSSTQEQIRKAWEASIQEENTAPSAARNTAASVIQGRWRASAQERGARNNAASRIQGQWRAAVQKRNGWNNAAATIQQAWQRWQTSNRSTHVIVRVRVRGEGEARRLEAIPICAASPARTEGYSCPICLEDMTTHGADPRMIRNRPSVWVGTFDGCSPFEAHDAQQDPVAALENSHAVCAKCSLSMLTRAGPPKCPLCRSPRTTDGNTLYDAINDFYTPTPEGWPPTDPVSVAWRSGPVERRAWAPALSVPWRGLDAVAERSLISPGMIICVGIERLAMVIGALAGVGVFAAAAMTYARQSAPFAAAALLAIVVGSTCVCCASEVTTFRIGRHRGLYT